MRQAEAEFAFSRELDPLHPTPRYNATFNAWYAGRYALVIERCDAVLDVDPTHAAASRRISGLIPLGRIAEALSQARAIAAAQPGTSVAVARLPEALAANGEVEAGARVLE